MTMKNTDIKITEIAENMQQEVTGGSRFINYERIVIPEALPSQNVRLVADYDPDVITGATITLPPDYPQPWRRG